MITEIDLHRIHPPRPDRIIEAVLLTLCIVGGALIVARLAVEAWL